MADRYWVGGSGTWDASSTANWSETSGGAGGASAPTSVDDVYFDSLSASANYTVTIQAGFVGTGSISNNVLTITAVTSGSLQVGSQITFNVSNTYAPDIDQTSILVTAILTGSGGIGTYRLNTSGAAPSHTIYGNSAICKSRYASQPASGTLNFSGNSTLTVAGSLIDNATDVSSNNYSGQINFVSTTSDQIVFNKNAGTGAIALFNTGTRTLGASISIIYIFIYSGTFNASNYTITAVNILFGSGAKTINLQNSQIYVTGSYKLWAATATNTTFDAGTSTINVVSAVGHDSSGFITAGLQYYSIVFKPTYIFDSHQGIAGNVNAYNLTLDNTNCGALTFIPTNFGSNCNINISNKLTILGKSKLARITVCSRNTSYTGLARTNITAAVYEVDNADFEECTFTNTTITGNSIGDCGGNVNIVGTTPKTVYWNNLSTSTVGWRNSSAWALTPTGTTSQDNYPLPQDTAIFTDAGISTGASFGFFNNGVGACLPNVDMSQITKAVTFTLSLDTMSGPVQRFYGDFIVSDSVTINSTAVVNLFARKNSVIDTKNKPIYSVSFNNKGAVLSITSGLKVTRAVSLVQGEIELVSADITCDNFVTNTNLTRGIRFGSNVINLTGINKDVVTHGSDVGWSCSGTRMFVLQGAPITGTRNIQSFTVTTGDFDTAPFSFRVLGGSDSVRTSSLHTFKDIIFEDAFTGTNPILWNYIVGNLRLSANMTVSQTPTGVTQAFRFLGNDNQTIQTNGIPVPRNFVIEKTGGTVTLLDDLNNTATADNNLPFTITNGTINLNSKKLSVVRFNSSASTLRTIQFNSGTLEVTGTGTVWDTSTKTNLTVTGPGLINLTSASSKTFAGGGVNYQNIILNQGGAGELTISGNNTFGGISNTYRPASIKFTAGSTTTVDKFMLNGTSGNRVSISSTTPGTRYTISKQSGAVAPYSCQIQDSSVTGGATWRAPSNYDNASISNNLGWDFSAINISTDNFMFLFSGMLKYI